MIRHTLLIAFCIFLAIGSSAAGGLLFSFTDPSGLAAEAEFTLINSTTLEVRFKNTSTGYPLLNDQGFPFSNSDQILTGVSWDFGHPGYNGDTQITGGNVKTGPSSYSLNFDAGLGDVGANADVSVEYGYGNMDGTGALTNFVSANTAQAIPFQVIDGTHPNLDGPNSIDGPQAGLVANPEVIALGGLGAIQDEVIATMTLSLEITDLDFLFENGVRFEFGSDAHFGTGVPEPSTVVLAGCGLLGLIAWGWRRRKR